MHCEEVTHKAKGKTTNKSSSEANLSRTRQDMHTRRSTQKITQVQQAQRAAAAKDVYSFPSAQKDEPARIYIREKVVLQHHGHLEVTF